MQYYGDVSDSDAPVVKQSGRWVYIPDPEEIPVTFQIGMVGSDGVLLASDRLASQSATDGPGPYRDTFRTDKIRITESKRIAYCCAGDKLSIEAGRKIAGSIAELQGDYAIQQGIYSYGSEAISEERQRMAGKQPWERLRGGSLLLVTSVPSLGLWRVDIALDRNIPCALKVEDKIWVGDNTTPAAFFPERYYQKRPIEELVFLAAHTVLTAGSMNPAGVGGLDIALCRPSGFEMLPAERVAALERQSEKLRLQISDSLFPAR